MASENSVTLVGNLTKDPELRYTTGGRGVASFGLAVNRRYQVNGEWQEQVSFFNIVAWGDLGENVAASMSKGNRAIVTGRLEQRSFETKEGEKRNVTEVIADELGVTDLDDLADRGELSGPTAWLLGTEAAGLSEQALALADRTVRVPLHGRAESLNLASAAAVCLYASARAHRGGPPRS